MRLRIRVRPMLPRTRYTRPAMVRLSAAMRGSMPACPSRKKAAAMARPVTTAVAIGTQDTTINCATGGLLVRELKLLEKYLPRDGKYKNVTYDIAWKNFTSGPPLTN